MAEAQTLLDRAETGMAAAANPSALSRLVCRSRAAGRLCEGELQQIALAAQACNRSEAITGVTLYNEDCFFQWLEGPREELERVMQSIRSDPRHADIEILRHEPTMDRRFRDWDVKLAASSSDFAALLQPAPDASVSIAGSPRKVSTSPPTVFARRVLATPHEASYLTAGALDPNTAAALKSVIVGTILPQLVRRHRSASSGLVGYPVSPRVGELADLMIASDPEAAFQLVDELQAEWSGDLPLYPSVFEPVARALGDLWRDDICTEFDVSLALCRMQTAVRRLGASTSRKPTGPTFEPNVLIIPEPGEIHSFGATLDSEVLWRAGWTPRCEYPRDDEALEDILAETWFDVLDLSLSAAFRRDHWLPRVTKTIANARRASRNDALFVIVGGRIFSETATASAEVGADCASATALSVEQSILWGLGRAVSPVMAPLPTLSAM